MTYSIGTVKHAVAVGADATVVLPSGHEMTADGQGQPVYAGEDLQAGQPVAWATWLVGCAIVGADTMRELPQVNADLADANTKLTTIRAMAEMWCEEAKTEPRAISVIYGQAILDVLDKP